ncbi:hypothetical protein [Pantoea stewartii]|uniref:Uncharacterized protein n=1 Tax=Pantoea stewartii TaxID=66269 RepID=A0AB34VJU9_9GAMM|nr:hypothetical protein [Pantoea stewartii]KTS74245.1 hypothetical protein RSA30_06315 [Pantoea stewartii]KTT00949.1 hypothetical protein RSA13_00560 [Pantoea stewartii]KTT08467.1 hypothetical protein RSA36_05605 [Pantoea stewartii]
MAWQGIPFPFKDSVISDNVLLTLSRLSELKIDSGFGWDNFSGTIVGAVIGAAIPAFIAFYTIKQNNKAGEEQRAQQVIELEKARETQLEISKRTFNAQVISANRQNWINDLRDSIVNFSSLAESHMFFRRAFYIEHKASRWNNGTQAQADIYFEKQLATEAELRQEYFKIKLMLNSNELTPRAMLKLILVVMVCSTRKELSETPKHLNSVDAELMELIESLLKVTQRCLKAEWKRVKAGT